MYTVQLSSSLFTQNDNGKDDLESEVGICEKLAHLSEWLAIKR